ARDHRDRAQPRSRLEAAEQVDEQEEQRRVVVGLHAARDRRERRLRRVRERVQLVEPQAGLGGLERAQEQRDGGDRRERTADPSLGALVGGGGVAGQESPSAAILWARRGAINRG